MIALNSIFEIEEQTDYLKEVALNSDAKWKIVTCHYPMFSPGLRDYGELREKWKPVIDEVGIDLVLQGHDHIYTRGTTVPLFQINQVRLIMLSLLVAQK